MKHCSLLRFSLVLAMSLYSIGAIAQQAAYQVTALKFGSRDNKIPVAAIAVGATDKDSVSVDFMFWLLKGNGRTILVDAGFMEDPNRQAITAERPDVVLKRIDIDPEDVTDIILTHPHWDHIGGIDYFPNAMVWMQQEDYHYFVGSAWQKDGNPGGFEPGDVLKVVQRNLDKKLTLITGDGAEIIPGIKVFTGSKHTFESQFVLVNTHSDKVIIASDNAWYYYNLEKLLPIPVTHDAKAYTQNLQRMKKMVPNINLILPGHDPSVFKKFPKVKEGIVRIRE